MKKINLKELKATNIQLISLCERLFKMVQLSISEIERLEKVIEINQINKDLSLAKDKLNRLEVLEVLKKGEADFFEKSIKPLAKVYAIGKSFAISQSDGGKNSKRKKDVAFEKFKQLAKDGLIEISKSYLFNKPKLNKHKLNISSKTFYNYRNDMK